MTFQEYIEDKYCDDDKSCYPFDGNNKYVFMFVMDEIEDELADHVVVLTGNTSEHPSEVFDKLMRNKHIEAFSYYADSDTHHVKAFINDEDTLTALKLIGVSSKCFDMLLKE